MENYNNNNNNDNNNNNNNNNKLKLFHFDNFELTVTNLHTKLIPQIFWFPKYTLNLHQELICCH